MHDLMGYTDLKLIDFAAQEPFPPYFFLVCKGPFQFNVDTKTGGKNPLLLLSEQMFRVWRLPTVN